jgi:predicted nucleic acid-binding Zn ribbon protein
MTDREEIRDIGNTMRDFLQGEGLGEIDELIRIRRSWNEIVGEGAASMSRPYRLEAGRLYVGVDSHARVQDMLFRVEEIKGAINDSLDMQIEGIVVKKINLK